MFKHFQIIIILIFAVIAGSIILISISGYKSIDARSGTSEQVFHTQLVLNNVEQISALSKDLFSESAGYYFTGDSTFLVSYGLTESRLSAQMANVRILTRDNPIQQSQLELLEDTIDKSMAYCDNLVNLKKEEKPLPSGLAGLYEERKGLRTSLDNTISHVRSEENRLLKIWEDANNRTTERSVFLFYALIGFVILLLFTSLLLVLYQYARQQRAEKRLRANDAQFHQMIDNIRDYAIYLMDKDGILMNWYAGAERIKGYSKGEIIGKSFTIFYTEEDIQNKVPEHNLLMAKLNGSCETQGWRIRKDGSRFWADIIISAIYNEDGEITGFAKVSRDYTLHKMAEDDIKAALEKEKELSTMKSNFVSMASHEFRTPLSSMLLSTSLIEQYKTTEQQEKREKHIRMIKSSIQNMTSILDEFLSLEKIEERKIEAKFQAFNLKNLSIRIRNETLMNSKPGQSIEYAYKGKENVVSDPVLIENIVTNLLSNAVKYSPEDSDIELDIDVSDHLISFRIKDNGMGIPKEDQKHLFERFFRASNVTHVQGTGLGLHIVKRYAEMMEGTIQARSELDKGTEFIVKLKTREENLEV